MEPPAGQQVAFNNLKPQACPVIPVKRDSTLVRNPPSCQSLPRNQPRESVVWDQTAPPPPPRRDNPGTLDTRGSGETVPLRSGDLLLENANETILVRANATNPIRFN